MKRLFVFLAAIILTIGVFSPAYPIGGLPGHNIPFYFGTIAGAIGGDSFNPSDRTVATITLSGGNLTFANANSSQGGVRSKRGKTTGKLHAEFTVANTILRSGTGFGFSTSSYVFANAPNTSAGTFWCLFLANGTISFNGSSTGNNLSTGVAYTTGDVLAIEVDFGAKLAWAAKNAGNWNNNAGGNPATGANGIDISAVFPASPAYLLGTTDDNINHTIGTLNVGRTTFSRTVSSGYAAWN